MIGRFITRGIVRLLIFVIEARQLFRVEVVGISVTYRNEKRKYEVARINVSHE